MYGRAEPEWEELEQAGWDFLKARAVEHREDAAHDPTVSYGDANLELAAMTGQPAFNFGQPADRAAMGYLLGRISRNRSWPASQMPPLRAASAGSRSDLLARYLVRLWFAGVTPAIAVGCRRSLAADVDRPGE
jgi:hypothetical protein